MPKPRRTIIATDDGRFHIKLDPSEYIERHDPPLYGTPDKHLIEACEPVPVPKCPAKLPPEFTEYLEQNQKLAPCCRHPEHHKIGAYWTTEAWRDCKESKGAPDVYILFCTCGRIHRQFMMGSGVRPMWEIR